MPDSAITHPKLPDFYEKNMKKLKQYHQDIWKLMKKNPPEPQGEIIIAENGEPNIIVPDKNGKKIPLHILENPGAEIADILNTVKENFDGTLIMTGMGLGYCPTALCMHRDHMRHLIIFEPEPGIFIQALKVMDLSQLLSDPRVILSLGHDPALPEVMAPATKALQLEIIQHVKHNPSFALDHEKYDALYKKINNYTSSANIEGNTFMIMGSDFFTNRLKHIGSIHHNYVFDDLSGMYKDMPAIIVSAGPSLDENIHILKQALGKAVILAVDSALPSLVAKDIMPGYVTTIDPLELIYEKVATVSRKVHDVSLICMSWVSCKMAKLFPADKVFWCFGAKPVEKWMADIAGCKTLTAGATSVAHLNLLAAIWMGCSPIVFLGQDLSFSHSKSHSSDTTLPTRDLINDVLKNEKDIIWLDGVNGEKVPSNRGFDAHRRYFETMIEKEKGYYINATARGCHIRGTEVMPLQEVIDRFCTKKIDMVSDVTPPDKKKREELRAHIIENLKKVIKKCSQIKKMLKETKHLLTDLKKMLQKAKNPRESYQGFNDLPPSSRKKILKLDKLGEKLDNYNDIWPLMQEVTMAGLRTSEQLRHAIDLVENSPENYIPWLKKNLKRLETINNTRMEVLPLFEKPLLDNIDFLQAEGKIFLAINGQKDKKARDTQILRLISLYFDTENIALALPWLEKLSTSMADNPAVNLFKGIIAAHYTEYSRAEDFFKKAISADPGLTKDIEKFRNKQGDAYVSYAPVFDKDDKTVARRLLLKGMIYAPGHRQIKKELKLRSDQSMAQIKEHEKKGALAEVEEMIDDWVEDLLSSPDLSSVIGIENSAKFHYYKGISLLDKGEINNAVEHFTKACDFMPDNPVFHISLFHACFAENDYVKGITHLKKAVSLDNAYAVYWEELGDELVQSGQYEDALAAFENSFLILPGHTHLLKKIGDCYRETGQFEAAREAYSNLNILLKKP